MNQISSPPSPSTPPQLPPVGVFRRFVRLAGPFWGLGNGWRPLGMGVLLVALTVAQVDLSLRINEWSAGLFDSLEQRSLDRFLAQIGALALILVSLMTVSGTHLWIKRRLQLNWRNWLTRRLLDRWMAEGRHFQLTHLPGAHDNPDGRIAEDIRIATEWAVDLAHSLFYCALLLVGFAEVLWEKSGILTLSFGGAEVDVPGHMVWVALVYAGTGSALAFLLGRPLIRAVDGRQTAEANFRFSLVRAREHAEAIALLDGEPDERRRLLDSFKGIRAAWNRHTRALARIFVFSSGFSVLSTAFPLLVAAPRYIGGSITLGVLMQTAQAFQQLVSSLSWPVENLPKVAEWRASVERVLALVDGLDAVEEHTAQDCARRIRVERGASPALAFHDLSIASPGGAVILSGFDARVEAGEHVLITGDSGAALKLFKVVAGLWPWGSGRVELPGEGEVFFLPQRPYLPLEPLRDALAYPAPPGRFDEVALISALERVGLSHMISRLDETAAWEQALTVGEQQRLGFARLLLHRPAWIFIQEATDALGPQGEEEMMALLRQEFANATVLTVGHHAALEAHHQRKLDLIAAGDGRVLVRDLPVQAEPLRPLAVPRPSRRGPNLQWWAKLMHSMKEGR